MCKKFTFLILSVLCLTAAACATRAPSEQVAGVWVMSVEESLLDDYSQVILAADPELSQNFLDSFIISLNFDPAQGKVILSAPGEAPKINNYTVVSESVEDGLLVLDIDGHTTIIRFRGGKLFLYEPDDSSGQQPVPLVFNRAR